MRALFLPLILVPWAPLAAEDATLKIEVCLEHYSKRSGNASYRVDIDWNGYNEGAARYDIGIEDSTYAIWPQWRDNRLTPKKQEYVGQVVVSDVSPYPLQFGILRFDNSSVKEFDEDCTNKICSTKIGDGIEWVGQPVAVPSVQSAVDCSDTAKSE